MSKDPRSRSDFAMSWRLGAGKGEHLDHPPGSVDSVPSPQVVTFDALMPATMAARCEESGVKKASMDTLTLLVLSVLAGAFISFGAIFATTVSAGSDRRHSAWRRDRILRGAPVWAGKAADRLGILDRPDPGHRWRRGALYR